MSDLKVRVFKHGNDDPSTTVTIPGGILKVASKLIPRRAIAALADEGIDIDEIVRLSESQEAVGVIARVEDHEKNEIVVVALEAGQRPHGDQSPGS
jgi:F0F1-type ATP synthase epsilon subunit